jgi:hypothetical protein
LVTAGFLNRVQIRALKILDEREHEECLVVEVPYNRRHLLPLEICDGAEATFTGDELIAVTFSPNGDGLQQSIRPYRSFEVSERAGVKVAAWLKGIGPNTRRCDSL